MSRHLSIRIACAEFDFLNRLAAEKGITRTAVARQLLLQNLALDGIKSEINYLLENRLETVRAELAGLHTKIDGGLTRDDLIKATNYIVKEIKK